MSNPTASSFNRTVLLRGDANIFEETCGATAIKPGHLVQRKTVGGVVVAAPHDLAGGRNVVRVATENPLSSGGSIDTAYAAGDVVRCHIAHSGDIVKMILKSGQNVTAGTPLISAGDGTVQASAEVNTNIATEEVIGEAYEAVDASGAAAFIAVLVW